MKLASIHFVMIITLLFSVSISIAQDVSYEDIVRGNLKKMTKLSGTFDLYDSDTETVRNLRMLEILKDIKEEDGKAFVPVRFRDIKTGDIVIVEVKVTMVSEGRYDSKWTIKEVRKLNNDSKLIKEDFTDKEVQEAMREYVEQQSKFTGHLMLFDPKAEKMRKLELLELDADVRRYGILSISTGQFKDIESQEKLAIDINVKNNKGKLEVETLKIKKVKK